MKISTSKFLITGGAGGIGSQIARRLVKEKATKVIVLDTLLRGRMENIADLLTSKNFTFVHGDIRDKALIEKLTKGVDYVFHEAVIRLTLCDEDPILCKEVLIDGTLNVLEACRKNKVKKIIFSSSSTVYGEPDYLPMNEIHPFNNKTLYGAAKIACEQLIQAYYQMYKLNYVILRLFNVYGPGIDIYTKHKELLPRWLDHIDKGTHPVILDNPDRSLDLTYIDDVIEANMLALKNDKVHEGIFNIGTGKETTLAEILTLLGKLTNKKVTPIVKTSKTRVSVSRRVADTLSAKTTLNFTAKVNIENGLARFIDWRKEQHKK